MSRRDRSILKRVVGIGLVAFLLGYALTAVLFFRSSNRPDVVTVPDLRDLSDAAAERRLSRIGLELQVGDSLPHPQVPAGNILTQSPLPGREVAPGTSVRVLVSSGQPRRPVPDVTVLTQGPAAELLAASGFQVQIQQLPSPLPAGRVIGVVPEPGTQVQLPATVQLQVSAGPPLVEVPVLIGLREDEARSALESVGLRLGEVEHQSGALEGQEMVIEQRPVGGDSIRMGTPVQVRILTNRPGPEREPGGTTEGDEPIRRLPPVL